MVWEASFSAAALSFVTSPLACRICQLYYLTVCVDITMIVKEKERTSEHLSAKAWISNRACAVAKMIENQRT